MRPLELRKDLLGICAAALFCALLAVLLIATGKAGATEAEELQAKLATAREEASAISSRLQAATAELANAEAEADDAAAREEELSGLLMEGQERTAELARKLKATERRLAIEKARLRRSRELLAERLVNIYETGVPTTESLVFGSGDYEEFATRADYLQAISEADSALADRVAAVRVAVQKQVSRVADLKAEAVAYEEQLEAARAEISEVRAAAQASAARLQSLTAGREAALAALKTDIAEWVDEIQQVRAAEERAATEAEAEEEVGRWLGGPYSIPTYIVMCESGGNYSALNPSSGAGGAYQIIPSTWEAYGGEGAPHEAPKAEQDRIAGEIWADSGPSAWVCA